MVDDGLAAPFSDGSDMVARRKETTGRSASGRRTGGAWRDLAPAGGLLGTVLGILVITAILQANGEDPVLRPAGTDPVPHVTDEAPPQEARSPEPRAATAAVPARGLDSPAPVPPVAETLEARARQDYERMFANPGRWTLQLMVGCDPDNVRKQVTRFPGESDLYILPMDHKGRSCYRICWGMYDSRDAALAEANIPASLRAEIGHPEPREIAAVTP